MSALRILIAPFAVLYTLAVYVRNWLFDIGVLSTTKVSVPVISVGNISTGGVGKTPLVEHLARHFREKNKSVAVISRGYKRTTTGYVVVSNGAQRCAEAAESGDEPSQLAEKLDGVVVVVDENRVRAAQNTIEDFKPEIILLDDGFQHRYLHRDLNIAVVAADELFSGSWLLPAGNRREPYSALRRADLIVLSHCSSPEVFRSASERLARWVQKPVVGMKTRPTGLRNAQTRAGVELISAVGKRVVAFSGIGNPSQFEQTLDSLSIEVAFHHRFADHHRYTAADIEMIQRSFKETRADYLVTTEKDVARLRGDLKLAESFLIKYPVNYLEIQLEIIAGEEALMKFLTKF